MGKKKNANRELTHEEIWDDSALVRSWDEAVEEYKRYHSIHAKGENVEDILREAEAAEAAQEEGLDYAEGMETGDAELEAPIDVGDESAARVPSNEFKQTAEADESQAASSTAQPPEAADESRATGPGPAGAGVTMPHMLLGQVQDEGLKNLMMAWYYAGYYTGLYEGQQRANQRANP
ncbi:hypothetical protein M432DRAFT_57676 [Thermoascus aurantiacus ATCC 26904]